MTDWTKPPKSRWERWSRRFRLRVGLYNAADMPRVTMSETLSTHEGVEGFFGVDQFGRSYFLDTEAIMIAGRFLIEDDRRRLAAALKAASLLGFIEAFVPRRQRNEEIGDALEFIHQRRRSRAMIYAKVASTAFWIGINALRELMSVAWGRATK